MKPIRIIISISLLALLLVTASGVSSQGSGPQQPDAPADTIAAVISYQGRLVHPVTGAPLSGTYDLEFAFWSLSGGGSQIGATISRNAQAITNGLYSTQLEVDPANINGQELWLQIRVRTTGGTWETLTPRVQVLPTAYALSLRPGAFIQGEPTVWTDGWVLGVNMTGTYPSASAVRGSTATGSAIRGSSTGGYGLYGYSEDGYGVYGYDGGSSQARGYGGYFSSQNGVGVYGYSGADTYYKNVYSPGVYGKSFHGAGIYGVGTGTSWTSYGGVFEGRVGVSVRGTGSEAESGYAARFVSQGYRGIYVRGQTGYYDGYFDGTAGIYVAGGIHPLRAERTIVVNGGDETLEPGDVVAIAGVSNPLMAGGEPLLSVRKVSGASDTAVIGVVVQAMRVQEKVRSDDPAGQKSVDVQPSEGTILPGGYLAIVSHGLVPAVKVDAATVKSLHIGDLLTSSTISGRAEIRRVDKQPSDIAGTILGKVAGPLDPKTGTVPVFVTLQ
jgi:hypothetical protein